MTKLFAQVLQVLIAVCKVSVFWLTRLLTYLESGIGGGVRVYIPNALTMTRLILGPFVAVGYVYGVYAPHLVWAWVSIALFIVMSAFDYFDGYLSRRWCVETAFGAKWDPFADKVLVLPLLPALWIAGQFGWWLIAPAIIIGLREPGVDLLRQWCEKTTFPSSPMAKRKTALQMVSLGILMFSHPSLVPELWLIGAVVFWVAAILSLLTGLDYLARVWHPLDWLIGSLLTRLGVRPSS